MFFNLRQTVDERFEHSVKLSDTLYLNTDAGWTKYEDSDQIVVFKGYADGLTSDGLLQKLLNNGSTTMSGNFLAFIARGDLVNIISDDYRSTPVYHNRDTNELGNVDLHPNRITASASISVTNGFDVSISDDESYLYGDDTELDRQAVIDGIDTIIRSKFEALRSTCPLKPKFFFSGGIDTLVCWSYLKNMGFDYELLVKEHVEPTTFMENFGPFIRENYWAYKQIHSFNEPSILVSGAMGDECLMRSPLYGEMWLQAHGLSYPDLIKETDYHHYYHLKDGNRRLYESVQPDTIQNTKQTILRMLINDHQHWHLDQTLTFTPYKSLEITKLLLRLPISDLIPQMTDAAIGKELVKRNYPSLLCLLEPYKNKVLSSTVDRSVYLPFA